MNCDAFSQRVCVPALLYLVPACLLSVVINALRLGEFKEIWEFNEEKIIKNSETEMIKWWELIKLIIKIMVESTKVVSQEDIEREVARRYQIL